MTITNSITNKKVEILYHPKCFSVPSKTLTTEDIDEDLSIEKLGMYNKPVGLSLLSLAKQDASDANIAAKQAWSHCQKWSPSDDVAHQISYVKDCKSSLLMFIDEYPILLKIMAFSSHNLVHLTEDSNRTVISRKLATFLWNAAFNLFHNYPTYVKSKPVLDMFSALRDSIHAFWKSFDYNFSLGVNSGAPSPVLNLNAMLVDRDEVGQAIAIEKMKDELADIFENMGERILDCIGMVIPTSGEGAVVRKGNKLVTAEVTKAFGRLEKVCPILLNSNCSLPDLYVLAMLEALWEGGTKTRATKHDILDKDLLNVEFDSFAPPAASPAELDTFNKTVFQPEIFLSKQAIDPTAKDAKITARVLSKMAPSSSKGILKRKLEEAAFKKQMEKVDITRDFAGMSVSPSPKPQRVLAPIRSPGGPPSSGVVLVPNTPSPPPVPLALQPDIIVDLANKETSGQEEGNNATLDKGKGRADDVDMFDGERGKVAEQEPFEEGHALDVYKDLEDFLNSTKEGADMEDDIDSAPKTTPDSSIDEYSTWYCLFMCYVVVVLPVL